MHVKGRLRWLAACLAWAGCAEEPCGPSSAVVEHVVDGDTVILEGGERVRYLLVDTPEISGFSECYGIEAVAQNEALVMGRTVELVYDEVCRDRYDRLLAYVLLEGREVNLTLVERGYACVLVIPPNGADREDVYREAEQAARERGLGLWGACDPVPC